MDDIADSEDTNTIMEEELEYSDDAETCTSTSTSTDYEGVSC